MAKKQPDFKHDDYTYTTMLGSLGRAKQFGAINKLLNEMVREGVRPNTVTYNRLIHSYGRANYLKEAMNVFNQMQSLDASLTLRTSYSARWLIRDVLLTVTYNIMIDLHAKARNYQSALKLYRDMQSAGFKPDKVTYSIVMVVLGHCGYLEEAEGVFAKMEEENWVPDEPVYGLLVDLWGKLVTWRRRGIRRCLVLGTFLRVNKISEASELLQNMLALGLRPLQTYTLLLSCCTDGRSKLDMGFCGQLMARTGHPAHMFLLKMPSAGPDGQNVRSHANSFLDLMHSEDRESKRGLVDAVVDFLHKSGLKEEAGSVWEVAAQKNVFPDALREKSRSYWLINLHVMSEGTAVTALSRTLAWFRKQMLVSGCSPARIDIVTGWGRRSRVTGTSMVRQAVEELLNVFGSPFFTESGNSGCFVGCGEALNRWLVQSYVERMHLL
ncbi:hypothetical protein Bca52824_014474 [Brassica carinata]|uniref:Smr domain-containing protein n=1 Tax=Brassica carinata TaxID=52824 RepID=A0A8X7W0G2_BRACI|nr:hypothetical protein Bca52824_014474 [Brassica carinata]